MKEINVHYQNQVNYQLPCIATKKQNEIHIGVWANRHRQYLKQHHRIRYPVSEESTYCAVTIRRLCIPRSE